MVREGLTLAIVGRPNVGKSSLFNRLLEQDRAIVTDIPGTTRDLVSETAAIAGIPVTCTTPRASERRRTGRKPRHRAQLPGNGRCRPHAGGRRPSQPLDPRITLSSRAPNRKAGTCWRPTSGPGARTSRRPHCRLGLDRRGHPRLRQPISKRSRRRELSSRRPVSSPACATSIAQGVGRLSGKERKRSASTIPHEMLLLDLYAALSPSTPSPAPLPRTTSSIVSSPHFASGSSGIFAPFSAVRKTARKDKQPLACARGSVTYGAVTARERSANSFS